MDAILLAAGMSARFGKNKLLYPFRGKPMYRYVLECLSQLQTEKKLDRLIVVTQFEQIVSDLTTGFPNVDVILNEHPEKGISESIGLGLGHLLETKPQSEGCFFSVSDQPYLTTESVNKIISLWEKSPQNIVAASASGEFGNPVIFPKMFYGELLALEGDRGGKRVLFNHRNQVLPCEIPSEELKDFDSLEAILEDSLPFLREKGHVISIVGAGGKSTCMDVLAQYYAAHGQKVVMTTTTHIRVPDDYPVAGKKEELDALLRENDIVVVGDPAAEGKLMMSAKISMEDCRKGADMVLIEADGAKHFPCKVPAEWEPVILPESDIVLGIMGMDALGNPLEEVCFRKEQAMRLLNVKEDHLLTPDDLAVILSSVQGTRKEVGDRDYYVILNKCDDDFRMQQGERIRLLLMKQGIVDVLCVTLKTVNIGGQK